MAAWPGNPVATLTVFNSHGGTSSEISGNTAASSQQVVGDVHIDFSVDIAYHDHPYFDHGVGFFSVKLDVLTPGGWAPVTGGSASHTLGNDSHDGDWSGSLTVSRTMQDVMEQYRLVLHCETQRTSLGTHADLTVYLQAVQGSAFVADFTLDFVPISIVYCPPGQDMTASLTQSDVFGTKLTIGQTESMRSDTRASVSVSALGLLTEGVGFSDSQSVSNRSESGIEISHFRNTVVTADNQQAIGRAYWGPLGDIFVIAVNPSFSASRRADGTILYAPKDVQQVLLVPAWKLLRPGNDPIAAAIPADARRRLLGLDPFIANLDLFFPDSGADLALAANAYADPTANNRAELIGRWWLDDGVEIRYTVGDTLKLFSTQTNEVQFQSTVSIDASASVPIEDLKLGLGLNASDTTTVGFQSSKETDAAVSRSAACLLIRDQNNQDLDGIQLYFDKVFSTLMFRRVQSQPGGTGGPGGTTGTTGTAGTTGTGPLPGPLPWPGRGLGGGFLLGRITGPAGAPLRGLQVYLTRSDGAEQQASTDVTGRYEFANLAPGEYTLVAGDRHHTLRVGDGASPLAPVRADLAGVRRMLDLARAPVWEAADALGLPTDVVRRAGRRLGEARSEADLARLLDAGEEAAERWRERVVLVWPGKGEPTGGTPPAPRGRRRRRPR